MSVALVWVVSPNPEMSNCGYLESVREVTRQLDSSRFVSRDRNPNSSRLKKVKIQRLSFAAVNAELRYSRLSSSRLRNGSKFVVHSSLVAHPAGEMAMSSEQKVYDVVLKQAALVKRQLRSKEELEVKPDIVLPGTLSLLGEAYDRCGEVCAEYAKTFYLG